MKDLHHTIALEIDGHGEQIEMDLEPRSETGVCEGREGDGQPGVPESLEEEDDLPF